MSVYTHQRVNTSVSGTPGSWSVCKEKMHMHTPFSHVDTNQHSIIHPVCVCVCYRKQVLATKAEAERDGVKVPTTLAEYCVRTRAPPTDEGSDLLYDDYYDDEDLEDNNDEDCCYDEDDSGNEES